MNQQIFLGCTLLGMREIQTSVRRDPAVGKNDSSVNRNKIESLSNIIYKDELKTD